MNGQSATPHRADRRATVTVLTIGTLIAVVIFAASFVVRLIASSELADSVGAGAVVALLLTPAAGLATTAVELRSARRSNWGLAVVVLLILGVAAVLALVQPK